MIKVIGKETLKTKVYIEKDGIEYAIVVSNVDRVDAILQLKSYNDRNYWCKLRTKSIKTVFGVQKAILLTQLGFIKNESILINPACGEV